MSSIIPVIGFINSGVGQHEPLIDLKRTIDRFQTNH